MKIEDIPSTIHKTISIMKKYIIPSLKIEEAEAAQMLAESLPIDKNTTVNAGDALVVEDNSWNIWGEE